MIRKDVKIKQIMYEEFNDHEGIKIATATEWWNGEGLDITIQRKHLVDINMSITHNDIALFRKIFSDFDF